MTLHGRNMEGRRIGVAEKMWPGNKRMVPVAFPQGLAE